MKLKPKSMMKSSFAGRGMAWWDRLSTVLEEVVQILPCQRWGERGPCPLSMFLRNKYRLLWSQKLCLRGVHLTPHTTNVFGKRQGRCICYKKRN